VSCEYVAGASVWDVSYLVKTENLRKKEGHQARNTGIVVSTSTGSFDSINRLLFKSFQGGEQSHRINENTDQSLFARFYMRLWSALCSARRRGDCHPD